MWKLRFSGIYTNGRYAFVRRSLYHISNYPEEYLCHLKPSTENKSFSSCTCRADVTDCWRSWKRRRQRLDRKDLFPLLRLTDFSLMFTHAFLYIFSQQHVHEKFRWKFHSAWQLFMPALAFTRKIILPTKKTWFPSPVTRFSFFLTWVGCALLTYMTVSCFSVAMQIPSSDDGSPEKDLPLVCILTGTKRTSLLLLFFQWSKNKIY